MRMERERERERDAHHEESSGERGSCATMHTVAQNETTHAACSLRQQVCLFFFSNPSFSICTRVAAYGDCLTAKQRDSSRE